MVSLGSILGDRWGITGQSTLVASASALAALLVVVRSWVILSLYNGIPILWTNLRGSKLANVVFLSNLCGSFLVQKMQNPQFRLAAQC